METTEEWKAIPGFPNYFCSKNGLIKNKRGLPLKTYLNNGYELVALTLEGKQKHYRIHRLVAQTWIGDAPEGKHQVNHKDGVKTNNCVDNLEWCSPSENMTHFRSSHKTLPTVCLKFTRDDETLEFKTIKAASKHFGKALSTIWGASLNGKWQGWKVERMTNNGTS